VVRLVRVVVVAVAVLPDFKAVLARLVASMVAVVAGVVVGLRLQATVATGVMAQSSLRTPKLQTQQYS
jgi:hypothetical protein